MPKPLNKYTLMEHYIVLAAEVGDLKRLVRVQASELDELKKVVKGILDVDYNKADYVEWLRERARLRHANTQT